MPERRVVTGRSQDPRERFAQELRRLRTERGESLRQLGEQLGWDASLFSKMENGESMGGPEVVEALDAHYGLPGLLIAMWEVAMGDVRQFRKQYQRYMGFEAKAVSLWHHSVSAPPGLLQTPAYAREALAAGGLLGEELDQQVEARMSRKMLLEGPTAPPFRVILSEAVLRTQLSDPKDWRGQLEYLAEAAERPKIKLQVVPFSAGPHGLMNTTVKFLRMPDGTTVAYMENDPHGELIQENSTVEILQRTYDGVRDLALSPAESLKFIMRVLEEVPCEPST
ncbi:helix-turn-helix transcriptional regulator [Streptomyces sp. NPDC051576]|uniref:helix-turn-helix domain-containing protein n=1 Tax=Streptomyces sp. NPDC051576 TaxID=3155803 RepID=UPI00344295A3